MSRAIVFPENLGWNHGDHGADCKIDTESPCVKVIRFFHRYPKEKFRINKEATIVLHIKSGQLDVFFKKQESVRLSPGNMLSIPPMVAYYYQPVKAGVEAWVFNTHVLEGDLVE